VEGKGFGARKFELRYSLQKHSFRTPEFEVISIQEEATRLLDANAKRGKGYYYTSPSRRKYPYQWSWDSSFHAIVNCHLGRPDLAREEILTLLNKMSPEGVLPHIIFHGHRFRTLRNRLLRSYWPQSDLSPLVQPPVVALAVRDVWRKTGDEDFLGQTLPLLERHFEWLAAKRRFGDSPLVSIISPWECGLDHKPAFDSLLGRLAKLPFGRYLVLYTSEVKLAWHRFDPAVIVRKKYFNVREVTFNTIYALGLEALSDIFTDMKDESKAGYYRIKCDEVGKAIFEECGDSVSGLCFDIDVNTGKFLAESSVSCLLPLALGNVPQEKYEALVSHLTNTEEFWLRFPVPSVPQNSRYFEPNDKRYLWRGPTWINTNWLIASGLRRHGYDDLADVIAKASRELVRQSGFCEYYNPFTGEGGGQRGFGWSTLVAII